MTARAKPSRRDPTAVAASEPRPDSASRATGPVRDRKQPVDLGQALIEAFLTNEKINQTLLGLLDPGIWNVFPRCSKRRNIATSFAHIHNVRCMRLKMSGRGHPVPARLDRAAVSMDDAREALAESARATVAMIERALDAGGHVPDHRPDVVSLVCASINHEAHHRGQISHWARELGSPLGSEQQMKLWEWGKLWKQVVAS